MNDLTRWNRAGLSRFQYLDGNAALFLERLREGLQKRFPAWAQAQAGIPGDETEEARKKRMEALYAQDPDDMLWQLTRQFARACHILGGHVDAYANEAYLGTATQWENLRRLVTLLDYAPLPPGSASTPLALFLKPGKRGTIAAGLQLKYSPPAGGAPLVFESLVDLEADARFNTLYARDHLRNPANFSGTTLVLEGRLDKLKSGEPLVLEEERTGRLSAHLVEGALPGTETTTVTLSPAVKAGFAKGWTRVHLLPKEKLVPLGPAASGVDSVGRTLQLVGDGEGLAAGDIVIIRSADDKPYYRRLKAVRGGRLVFHRPVGRLTLAGATVARPVTVPLSDVADPPQRRRIKADGTVVDVVYAAGDWSRLADQWLADIHKVSDREYLPVYYCLHAKYWPVTEKRTTEERQGYTALTLTWHRETDGVEGNLDLRLKNPQTLLAPPPAPGPWQVDRFLQKDDGGRLGPDLVTALCKKTAAGDLAVVVRGSQLAWARLETVALDPDREQATLKADKSGWDDRAGGPFFLDTTRIYSHFSEQVRAQGWQDNSVTNLAAQVRVRLEEVPEGLKPGRALLVDNGSEVFETTLADLNTDQGWIDLAPRQPPGLPRGTHASNLRIYANVVTVGHGESRPQRVLGSGDGTRNNQRFTLEVADLAFVADPTMDAGVRAALQVTVAGEVWTQVSSLKDSGPSDAHYQVRIDEDGRAVIQFGDGRHGRRLPSGGNNIRVAYRQGCGVAGNLPAGSLAKLALPHPLVDSVRQPIPAGGGSDRESSADLRENAPATLLALNRAVSLEDYAQLARSHASVWQARAFRLPPGLGRRERLEVVVMVAGGGPLLPSLQSELQGYLLAHGQPGVAINVTSYARLTFRLTVTLRVRTAAFDVQAVKDAVVAALEAAFSEQARQLGQALYRGEIYRTVDAIAGVENSDCRIQLDAPPSGSEPARTTQVGDEIMVAQPGPGQCLVFNSAGFKPLIEEYLP